MALKSSHPVGEHSRMFFGPSQISEALVEILGVGDQLPPLISPVRVMTGRVKGSSLLHPLASSSMLTKVNGGNTRMLLDHFCGSGFSVSRINWGRLHASALPWWRGLSIRRLM